jgi:hypothetical protein
MESKKKDSNHYQNILPENEYVVNFDLYADHEKTDVREILDSGP